MKQGENRPNIVRNLDLHNLFDLPYYNSFVFDIYLVDAELVHAGE